uniref:Notch 2 N-terminal-like protein n=1 Tax=Sipha flava TaxID=143950 RepID=A0A2S2QQX5_9HEMI
MMPSDGNTVTTATTVGEERPSGSVRFRWPRQYAVATALCVAIAVVSLALASVAGYEYDTGYGGDGDGSREVHRCGTLGGRPLVEPKGVITTPLFPGPFPVPIECEWVIQVNGDGGGGDTMVEVYFTQLFVTDGLTITEYSQYPPDFGFVTVREVFNKSHISQYGQSMLTTLPYLVIRFRLNRLEGNHIRVHDDLMDVYGFNITYEMRPIGNEREDVCSLLLCSYSGNCLGNADLTEYKCACFSGFSGDNCGYGPICHPNNTDSCENGGTCRHVGRSIAICNCPIGFTGGKCEVPVVNVTTECGSSTSCIQQCNINEDIVDVTKGPCQCNIYKNSSTTIDSVRYHAAIKLVNISAIVNENLNEFLQQKIFKYFKKHLNSHELRDLRITSILQKTGDVHFEFYSRKSDQKIVQDLLNQMITNGSLPGPRPVPLVKTALSFQQEPSLWLNKMDVNKPRDSIPEGEQFIISCSAQGPADMQFQWYKDGNPINTSISTRYIWTKIKKSEKSEYKSSILVIEHADVFDSGKFTCQVSDHSYQQCQSVALTVLPLPEVIMKPSVTVKPGDNVTIMCFLKNEFTKFGNTWLDSDMHLVKMDKNVYWEDLHRGGSVLYVKNITSSSEYVCEASNRAGRRNATVSVEVLDTNLTAHCAADGVWPLTGAGKAASVECPKNRSTSYASRTCVLTADNVTEWQTADYSRCPPDDLGKITANFHKKTLGYDKINVTAAKTLNSLYSNLQTMAKWYPGEGEPVIDFLMTVTAFLQTSHDLADLDQASVSFNNILSILLENNSIVNEKKIVQLLEMIETWTLLKAFYSIMNKGTKHYTNQIENIYIASTSEIIRNRNETTISHNFFDKQTNRQQPKVTVSMFDIQIDKWINKSFNVGITTFRNLSEFFPRKYFINKSQDGEIEYTVVTPVVAVSVAQDGRRIRKHWPAIVTDLQFDLKLPRPSNGTWNVTCVTASRLANAVRQWDVSTCRVLGDWSPSSNVTRCRCPTAGLFTVLARVVPKTEVGQINLKQDVIVIFGCVCCLVQSALSLVLLVTQWIKHPTCILYLKIQLCLAVVSQMCIFLYATKNNDYGYFSLGLQIVTIVEITSHLSQLLIVYTEIISFPQFSNIKLPIIGLATAAPVLFVLSIMLSLNIIGAKPIRPWWSWENSAFIYIYYILFVLLVVMYLSVLSITIPKLKFIKQKLQRNTPASMRKRMGLIMRSVIILLMVIVTTVSSILLIIYKEDFSKYVFSSSCALKGFVVFYCYVLHSEDPFDLRTVYRSKTQPQQSFDDNHSDSDGSPLNCFSKDAIDYDIKKSMKSDILEITDNPQEYFITQEKPVSIVSNLTSSLKKLDNSTEPKKSVTFRHDLITGCQEKSIDGHETDDSYDGGNCSNGNGNICSGGDGNSYRNGDNSNSCSPLLETTADVAAAYNVGGAGAGGGAIVDDWQLVQADFVDVPAGSDTSIRCVVQPPPDMLATHVCVEVGLVKSSTAAMATAAADKSEVPTIVVCSVDVEPCRQPQQQPVTEVADKCSADVSDDVLDRISQDLDYLLNRKTLTDPSVDRNPEQQSDVVADVTVKKRTKL